MRLCLVSSPTTTDFEAKPDASSATVRSICAVPQLGILTLAAEAELHGLSPSVIDLNAQYYDYLEEGCSGVDQFAAWAANSLLSTAADVYGLSSICSSYPLTIRIAAALKKARPECVILLGGPQASVVDRETLSAFPFIDFILRGEADLSLPLFLDEWQERKQFSRVPGLTYRSPFGAVRGGNAPVLDDLDRLPLPAFHLTGDLKGATTAPLELGRGCPFACTFCSTNDFFRRKFRLRSPSRVLADMRAIASTYGITKFELTHDMFTVDRKKVVAFCEHLIEAGQSFTWSCSARTDSVDEELLELMRQAGCTGIFYGVETGSERMQRAIDKDLDIAQAKSIISLTERLGITSTVSLITGFPEETWDDVRATLTMYSFSLRHPKCDPQFNLLSPLASTPIHSRHRDNLTLEELCSDMGHQGRVHNSADRDLIRKYPDIFPNFYLLPVPFLDRDYLLELREFMLSVPFRMRWLIVALHRSGGNILDIFSTWRAHRIQIRPSLRGWSLREYYMLDIARREFLGLVKETRSQAADPAVDCFLSYYDALEAAKTRQAMPQQARTPVPTAHFDDVPVRKPHVYVFELTYNVQAIIDSLKVDQPLSRVDRTPRLFRTRERSGGNIQLIETRPLIAAGLQACNGENTVADVLNELDRYFEGPVERRRLAAECLLETLQAERLIEFYRPANVMREPKAAFAANA